MNIITTSADIGTYIDNDHADIVAEGLRAELVEAIRAADHPRWGTDWTEWLERNITTLRDEVIAAADGQTKD